jgi:single-stranded DNA-binding protein
MLPVNKVILLGPVYQIKEIPTKSGKEMLAFSLKTWRSGGKDEEGNKKEDKKSWHKIIAYSDNAKILKQYLVDGKIVYLEGTLDYYKDKDGLDRTQVILNFFSFFSDKKDEELTSNTIPF